jgi:c-di-GMP-related signal transduction protein
MSATDTMPLAFFRVLADRGGAPAALLLSLGPGDSAGLAPLTGSEHFAALNNHLPCLYPPGLDPALAALLAQARWRELDPATVFHTDEKFAADAVPAGAAWVDGAWTMQMPAKAQGAQAASRTLALQLVQLVAADAHTHEIEALLRHDATLSYHLLRLVNSLGMGTGRNVNSFSQAILLLGRQQLRRWLNLMLFAARQGDLRSPMLLARVAVRSRTLETLAKTRGLDKPMQEQAFMAGMFSLLGVLFGMPLEEVLAPLPIGDALRAALLRREGDVGAMLAMIELAEQGDLAGCAAALGAMQLTPADFNEAAVAAHRWMLDAVRENKGKTHG